jgi:hypothetical protein
MSNWKDTAELVGIAAIVASLIFVGMQMRQDQEIAEAEIYAQSNQLAIELANLVNQDREIWLRGIAGQELNEEEEAVFENIYMAILLNYGGIWQRANRLSTRSPDSVAKQFAYLIYAHPGLRRIWERRKEYEAERNESFGGGLPGFPLTIATTRILEELDSGPSKPPQNPPRTPW